MHGRQKIKKEDIDEVKRKAREQKAKAYAGLCQKVLALREANALTTDALALTLKVAEVNPEFYTVWNYRREILQALLSDMPEEKRVETLEAERSLTEQGLMLNPKSYWVWNHRRWVVLQLAEPWEFELKCCAKFLNADQRNFHCWNYRRWAAQKAGLTIEEDFQFTTSKIEQNFSNYSAWHQRASDLLLSSEDTGRRAFSEEERESKVDADFEVVQQAFYTEPDDQSAWFYHRWLVSRVKDSAGKGSSGHATLSDISTSARIVPAVDSIAGYSQGKVRLSVGFTHAIDDPSIAITVDGVTDGEWRAVDKERTVYQYMIASDHGDVQVPAYTVMGERSKQASQSSDSKFQEVVARESAMVNELAEIEPDSKWVLLTSLFLGIQARQGMTELQDKVDGLIRLDPMRTMHYRDLAGRHALDMATSELATSLQGDEGSIDLSNRQLSGHGLTASHVHRVLQACRVPVTSLSLANNRLTSLRNVEVLFSLESIDASNNDLVSINIASLKERLPHLSSVNVQGNPRLVIEGEVPPGVHVLQ